MLIHRKSLSFYYINSILFTTSTRIFIDSIAIDLWQKKLCPIPVNNNTLFHKYLLASLPCPLRKDNYIKKVWELYLLYPMFRSSHLPSEWIKQQQPTPIGYMIPITGKYISNDAGAIAIIFIPESNCEVWTSKIISITPFVFYVLLMRPTLQRMRIAAKVVKGFKSLAFIFKKYTAICSITFSLRSRSFFFFLLAHKRDRVSKQKSSIHNAFSVQNRWMRIQYFWIYVPLFGMCVQNFWTNISSPIIYFLFVASPNGWANTETIAWLMIHRLISNSIFPLLFLRCYATVPPLFP